MGWSTKAIVLAAALGVAGAGWLALRPQATPVEMAGVRRGPFVQSVLNEGKTRVRDRYVVAAPIAGTLARIGLKAGDAIDVSSVIATVSPAFAPLDDPRARLQLEERVGAAEAAHKRAAAAEARARARLDQARADLARTTALVARGAATLTRKEQDELNLVVAEREVQVAEFDVHLAGHEEALARVALQTAGVADAGARRVEIRSPINGVVLKVMQESEGPVALGAPIMEIGDPAQLEIIADVLTTDAVQISPGAAATIERWGGGQDLAARVAKVEPGAFTKVSALGIDEQRVYVVMDLTSPREQWRNLGDGFRIEARIEVARLADALTIPVSALFRSRAGWSAFVVEEGRARLRAVEVVRRNESVAAIGAGLKEGERVILFPPPAVRDGGRVTPANSPEPR